MREHHLALDLIVGERGPDLVPFELAVLVTANAQGRAVRLDEARKRLSASSHVERVAPRIEAHLPFFDNRDAVLHVGVAVARADVGVLTGPRAAEARGCRAGVRVLD